MMLVRSNDESSMVDFIERFLKALTKHNMKISPSKSEIGAQEISFLGHTISPRGVKPDAKKVDPLRKLPMPNNVSELRSLLGGLSYYRKFLPSLSRRLQPITRLLKKDVPFSFDSEMEAVVRDILKLLTKPPVLVYPDFEAARNGSRKFRLCCDASAAGFGATLEQPQKDNTVRPIVYLSRTVLPNEQGWASIKKEAGCIVWAIKRLRQHLFLIPFDIYTDHLPLTSLLRVGASNTRVQRWGEFLTAYNYRTIHRKGAAHGNADMLSRLCQPATEADAQGSCSITNPEDYTVFFVGASGMWPRSIPPSPFNVFIEIGFARQSLGVGGLLSAPDYSYDKSRNQYVYHRHEDVEKHVLHNLPSTWHSLCKRVLRQKKLPICTVQRYCNARTAMVAAVVAAQCTPQQSLVPLRRSPRKRQLSRVMIEAIEVSARNEPLASIDESNRTSEEGDTREIDVGTE